MPSLNLLQNYIWYRRWNNGFDHYYEFWGSQRWCSLFTNCSFKVPVRGNGLNARDFTYFIGPVHPETRSGRFVEWLKCLILCYLVLVNTKKDLLCLEVSFSISWIWHDRSNEFLRLEVFLIITKQNYWFHTWYNSPWQLLQTKAFHEPSVCRLHPYVSFTRLQLKFDGYTKMFLKRIFEKTSGHLVSNVWTECKLKSLCKNSSLRNQGRSYVRLYKRTQEACPMGNPRIQCSHFFSSKSVGRAPRYLQKTGRLWSLNEILLLAQEHYTKTAVDEIRSSENDGRLVWCIFKSNLFAVVSVVAVFLLWHCTEFLYV